MKKFWQFKNEVTGEGDEQKTERVLLLNGTIAEDSWWGDEITPEMFKEELESEQTDITVWINSPGGDVFAAAQIYNMLRDYPHKVTVKIDSLAASAATVVAMAGDEVLMSPVATFMIHNPSTFAWGDKNEMERVINVLDEIKESIINAYVTKSNLDRKKISNLMDNETWMNANKAMEYGFVDALLERAGISNYGQPNIGGEYSPMTITNSIKSKLAETSRPKEPESKSERKIEDCMARLDIIKKFI